MVVWYTMIKERRVSIASKAQSCIMHSLHVAVIGIVDNEKSTNPSAGRFPKTMFTHSSIASPSETEYCS